MLRQLALDRRNASTRLPILRRTGRSPTLSENEEVTLRRVAFGQSEVRAMRAQDLAQLRRLRLIENGKDGRPQLTADGKKCFEALPRPMTLGELKGADDFLANIARPVDRTRR